MELPGDHLAGAAILTGHVHAQRRDQGRTGRGVGESGAGWGAVTWLRRASCLKMGGDWEGMSPHWEVSVLP